MGSKAAWKAVRSGDVDAVESVLAGMNLEATDKRGMSPLHVAALEGFPDVVEALVGAGANVRAKDKDGYTPLHWAVEIGALDIVQYLMNHGAQLTAVDNKGCSPLVLALCTGNEDMYRLLIKKSVPVINQRDKTPSGHLPLYYALSNGYYDLAEDMVTWGADVGLRNTAGDSLLMACVEAGDVNLVETVVRICADDDLAYVNPATGNNAAHVAAGAGWGDVMERLFALGVPEDTRNGDGKTPRQVLSTFDNAEQAAAEAALAEEEERARITAERFAQTRSVGKAKAKADKKEAAAAKQQSTMALLAVGAVVAIIVGYFLSSILSGSGDAGIDAGATSTS